MGKIDADNLQSRVYRLDRIFIFKLILAYSYLYGRSLSAIEADTSHGPATRTYLGTNRRTMDGVFRA